MSIGNTSLHQSGEIPEIVKLPNGRIRVTRRFHKFTREDIDNANLGSLMGDFGDLDTAGEQISNQGYTNCRLISVEVDPSFRFNSVSNTDSAVLVKTYETLTDSFVQITDDTVTFTDNGLKQITRVYRAVSGTTSSNVVGTTALNTGETLASSRIEDSKAFAELTETYIESGVLSRTTDLVGSQNAITVEVFNPSEIPSPVSNFFYIQPDGTSLYLQPDDVSLYLQIEGEISHLLANVQESNVDGIPTKRYTFLKPSILSQSEDKVGSQLAITIEAFGEVPATPAGYSLARTDVSDFEGIKTNDYTFLKPSVLSRSLREQNKGALIIETVEAFNEVPTADTVGAVQIGNDISNVEGIPTRRYTFAKGSGEISRTTQTKNNEALIITSVTALNSAPSVTGVEISSSIRQEDGYTVYEKTAAAGSGEISRNVSTRNNGKLVITTVTALGTAGSAAGVEIEASVRKEDGYVLHTNTFARGDGQIRVSTKPASPALAGVKEVTVTSFGTPVAPPGVLIAESESEEDGYVVYTKTALQGTITGIKQTYKDVVDVRVAGTVSLESVSKSVGDISGTIAVSKVTPPSTKQIAATVEVEITTLPPNTAALAYDLGDISCSVTAISMSENFRGTDTFTTSSGNTRFSGQRKTADMSARISAYPECYLSSGTSNSGTFSYVSSHENSSTSPNSLVTAAQTSTTNTFVDGTGSTSDTTTTTGIIKRNSRPILTTLLGVTYYEVITWSV
jgi:hypothetical protein